MYSEWQVKSVLVMYLGCLWYKNMETNPLGLRHMYKKVSIGHYRYARFLMERYAYPSRGENGATQCC